MTSPTPRPTLPGWYDNPDNPEELRYFDGIVWTTHTTPRRTRSDQPPATPATTPHTPPPQQNAPPPPGSPWLPTSPPAVGQQPGTSGAPPQLASYGQRVLAYIADQIVINVVSGLIGAPLLWRAVSPVIDRFESALAARNLDAMFAAIDNARPGWLAAFFAVQLAVFMVYQVVCLTRWGATPGKRMVGIRVRRVDQDGLIDRDTAVRRAGFLAVLQALGNAPTIGLMASLVIIADLVWPAFDPRNQSLHDKVARTIVVKGPAIGR